jgi:hypothetical protein
VAFTIGGQRAHHRALVGHLGRSIGRDHAKPLDRTIGIFTWAVRSLLRITRRTTTGTTITTRSGAQSPLRSRGLVRRLRDRKRIRFLLPVRRARRPTSSRRMRSIHAPRGVRRLHLMRNAPVKSGLTTRITRTKYV